MHPPIKSILLVDDDSVFNFISTRLLESMDVRAEILTAQSTSEAMDILNIYTQVHNRLPSLILIDLYMSPVDGTELIQRIRANGFPGIDDCVMAVATSAIFQKEIEPVKALGIETIMIKPIREADLRQLVIKAGLDVKDEVVVEG